MKKNIQGQSFIELIAALVVISIALVALVSLITRGIANSTFSRTKTLATSYNQEALEWLRGERDRNWALFYQHTAVNWCLNSLNWTVQGSCGGAVITNTPFSRTVSFTRVNPGTVTATSIVSWNDGNGYHESQSTTTLTNWKGN